MKKAITFDDILIVPQFSDIKSRKDVDLITEVFGMKLTLPIISANMDTISGSEMAKAMSEYGAVACLHRFWSIEDNVKAFLESPSRTMCSVGIGPEELKRAKALRNAGCYRFIVDVAHGAQQIVVDQVIALREELGTSPIIIVGNFATAHSILEFKRRLDNNKVDGWKLAIGGGSMCLTRTQTGCGIPTLATMIDCINVDEPVILDGGLRTPGDIAKAIAAGADLVMIGNMLAGTTETPGDLSVSEGKFTKSYRGSASLESYAAQGKAAAWRTHEGESTTVPHKGPVKNVLQDIEGGLRSACTYVGAKNLNELAWKAEFVEITASGVIEGRAHGKR
jgi:IMP dehydrogenase